MLFQLSKQHYPNALQSSVMPEAYTNMILPEHSVHVVMDESCTLIHQTMQKKEYSFWVNNFIIHKPILLQILPAQKIYSLCYSMENTVKLLIQNKVNTIPAKTFGQLYFPPETHYGIFSQGIYRTLHINVDEHNRSIIQDQHNATALLREYYSNVAFQPH